jgi:hypothetical protein
LLRRQALLIRSSWYGSSKVASLRFLCCSYDGLSVVAVIGGIVLTVVASPHATKEWELDELMGRYTVAHCPECVVRYCVRKHNTADRLHCSARQRTGERPTRRHCDCSTVSCSQLVAQQPPGESAETCGSDSVQSIPTPPRSCACCCAHSCLWNGRRFDETLWHRTAPHCRSSSYVRWMQAVIAVVCIITFLHIVIVWIYEDRHAKLIVSALSTFMTVSTVRTLASSESNLRERTVT